ncbi:hypothetical protein J1N35_002070 [Gossypium stocksii]|uniref:Uncharacterized protein n=1 Tax=Gossypium stocksii TaxID=47602 RepID=A0A9D3WIX7_9ROSI|nr:hypothetical protein J1N35_002070 [Gossypium stocksii]
MSLKNFGLSDVCLATFSISRYNGDKANNIKVTNKLATYSIEVTKAEGEKDPNQVEVKRPILQVSKDGYENLPSYMISLTSWEDLLAVVEKINSSLNKKEKTKGYNYFYQDEIEALGLRPKGRAYLLLLVRMNHLIVETADGRIFYRVL